MKKRLLLTNLVLLFFGHGVAQVTVSGTGCNPFSLAPVDATYSSSGTQNGKNTYLEPNSFHQIEWTGSQWIIDFGGSEILFTNPTDVGVDPPASGWSVGQNSCTGSSAPTLSGSVGVLPVELVLFEAKVNSKEIFLSWQTASELNNERFEIEESKDASNFYKLGEIQGNGTTSEQQDYSYRIQYPESGIAYFRLKQVDFDGQFRYSDVISVNFNGEIGNVGDFYPNPSISGLVNLDYISQVEGELSVSIYHITGQKAASMTLSVSSGNNKLRLDFSALDPGIYLVEIDGRESSIYRKLIIGK